MSWLTIETTDRSGGVAWGSAMDDLKCETWSEGARQGEVLWPCIQALAGDRLEGIEGVIAGVGPGRLTGVRIGLTVAKIICMTHGVPLVTADRFDQIAADCLQANSLVAMVPLMGRRIAAQAFAWEDGWQKVNGPKFCLDQSLEGLKSLGTGQQPVVAGVGLEPHAEALRGIWPGCEILPSGRTAGDIQWLAEVGLAMARAGETTRLDQVRPIYYT